MERWTANQYRTWAKSKTVSKYRNQKCGIDGLKFDSKRELNRFRELKILERSGEISYLQLQPEFILQEKLPGIRAIKYRADFMYHELGSNHVVVEDVKGMKTQVYLLKKKLFMAKYPEYDFREV